MAYSEIEPFGPLADNLNFASITSLLFNTNRGKGQKAVGVEEMALGLFQKKGQTASEMKDILLTAIEAANKPKKKEGEE